MSNTILVYFQFFILLISFAFPSAEKLGNTTVKPCCVPAFFRSEMDVTGTYFNNKREAVPVDRLTHLYYDYKTNKTRTDVNVTLPDGTQFLHTEIADYAKHKTYKIDGSRCQIIHFNDPIQDRCIPSYATLESTSRIGSEHKYIDIHTWRYTIPGTNIVVKRAVTKDGCIPVYQMQYGLLQGATSSYVYILMDTEERDIDQSVMQPPNICHSP